jgi:hypothetical protein
MLEMTVFGVIILALLVFGIWLVNRASTATFYMFLVVMLLFGLAEKFGVLNLVN